MSDRAADHLTWRHRLLALLMVAAVLVVVARLAQLQIADHDRYLKQASEARAGAAVLPAPRGPILDAGGYPLAISVDTWDIYIDRYLWNLSPDEARTAAAELGAVLDLSREGLLKQGQDEQTGDVRVRRDLDYDSGRALQELDLWGVRVLPSAVRVYPEGDLAGPVLGWVGGDQAGLWGIEAGLRPHPARPRRRDCPGARRAGAAAGIQSSQRACRRTGRRDPPHRRPRHPGTS